MAVIFRGCIFDLDGVLLDSNGIWKDLGARYLRNKGLTPEPDLNRILFSMSMEEGAVYLSEHYPLFRSPGQVREEISAMIRNCYQYEIMPKTGAQELLRALHAAGMIITAATSSPKDLVTYALKRNLLYPYFTDVLTTSDTGISKHSPDIYLRAAEIMHIQPSEIAVFEDSLYALKTAKQAGFHVIGIYDENGETDQSGLKTEAEQYLFRLSDFFLPAVSL